MRVHVTTELDAMRGIVAAMESLCDDDAARRRVMRWVVDRYARDVATVTAVGIQLPVEKPLMVPPSVVDTVSMPEPACAHESWEADSRGNASKCTDCGAILPPNWADKVAEPPFHALRSRR